MQEKIPVLVAHRGYPAAFPENTLEGITAALAAGARFVEFDVQLSADVVPVLSHDRNLKRTAGINVDLFATAFAALRTYSVGEPQRFGDKFSNARIPSLAEVVEVLKQWPRASAFVEIKRSSLRRFGRQVVLAAVLDVIRPVQEQCIVISFDRKLIEATPKLAGLRRGWVMQAFNDRTYRQAVKLSPEFMFFNVDNIPAADKPLRSAGWDWVVYAINDPQQALELAARGIQYVETDAIAEMLQHPLLKQQGSDAGG